MAIANNTTAGTITFAGDLQGTFDVPELSPTGVVPGEYQGVSLVVDTKGRTIYARSMTEVDVPCATISSCGVVAIGDNITDEGAGLISIALATINSKGVIKVGSGFTINGCILDVDYDEATTTLDGVVIVPTAGNLDVDGSGNISVPLATNSTVGVLEVDESNGLTITAGVLDIDSSNITDFPIATDVAKGILEVNTSSSLTLVAGVLDINIADATTSSKGIVQIGSGLSIASGVLSLDTLSDATTSSKGIVQIGSGIVDTSGVISISEIATAIQVGYVSIGSGLGVDGNGELSRGNGNATTSSKGIVQIGNSISVASGVISLDTANNTTLGLVKPLATTRITVTSGDIDTGTNVPLKDENNTFTKSQYVTSATPVTSNSITPDFDTYDFFDITISSGAIVSIVNPTSIPPKGFKAIIKISVPNSDHYASLGTDYYASNTNVLIKNTSILLLESLGDKIRATITTDFT